MQDKSQSSGANIWAGNNIYNNEQRNAEKKIRGNINRARQT